MPPTVHHIGVDEAGLGPNLGPLLIVATRWSLAPTTTDELWNRFSAACTQTFDNQRLHVGDSKTVYKNKSSFDSLERSARGILSAADICEGKLAKLINTVDPDVALDGIPWLEDVADEPASPPDNQLADLLSKIGGSLQVAATVVPANRFNAQLDRSASKGQLLSQLSLQTLRRVWSPEDEPTAIWCDKHGGRNRYDDLLLESCDGAFVVRHEEGRASSRYTVGQSEIVFGVKSERHFPVACSSLIAKYLRQRAMRAFNSWWAERVPEIRPTEGYPQDAKRFRNDVAATRATHNVPDNLFWRMK